MYKVYKHTSPSNKVYIGITMQEPEKRWANGRGYNDNIYFSRAIKKYGWNNIKHEIIAICPEKEKAELLEIFFINLYKSNNRHYGYNIENGGNHKGKTSDETRKKLSISHKGQHSSPKTEFKKGQKVIITEEMKKKISSANKGKHACVRTEFKKGHKPLNVKRIICIETNIVYESAKEASIKNNINYGHISSVCKGKRKSAGKLHWKYYE